MRRVIRRAGVGLGLLILLAVAGGAGALWWSLPPRDQVAGIAGLSAPVRVGFDEFGIPRIQAANAQDGAAALGFVHARDRMFQMEMMRRVASGRVSELAGASTLRLDRTMRVLGLRRRAEAEVGRLDPAMRGMLDAYAAGVNAWIGARGRFSAPEFIVLGAPEPWTPADTLLWGKTMALYLGGGWRGKLDRAALLLRLPPEQVRRLWPAQDGAVPGDARLEGAATRLAGLIPAFPEPFTLPTSASNEWAVDGRHSATGAPLLAGDPHLAYTMPDIWYLARVETPEGVLAGATAPGVPFMILGHNGRIAWTFTTTGADTQDVFIETPAGEDRYEAPGGPLPYTHHAETIRVRGGADEVIDVRETRHGPVVSDLDRPAGGGRDGPVLAVAMASLSVEDTAAAGLFALNRAATVAEAGDVAALISAPVQNLLVADGGHIGRFTTGTVPVRRAGDGTVPVPGADGAHDWTGFATGAQLPTLVDPASGRIVNANERIAPADFPVFLGQDWFGDWRARRIRTLLDARSSHSVASFAAMQVDTVSAFAQAVLPRLLETEPADADSRAALVRLRRWSGDMRTDQGQPLLFNAWMRRIDAALRAPDKLGAFAAGAPSDMIARALGPEEATWCGGGCGTMLRSTLAEAVAANAPDVLWGDVHQASFPHALLGRLPVVGGWFTWSVAQPGDDTTVFRGTPAPDGSGWQAVHGPGFRGVYDLHDLANSRFTVVPGQSGNPLRGVASDLMERWRTGAGVRLGPTAPAVETIELHP